MKTSLASKTSTFRDSRPILLLATLLLLSSCLVSAQLQAHGLDLGFAAPGEISFHLDRYIEELSYNPSILESTYFNNWKRSAAPLRITDTVNLTTVGDISPIQKNNISFFQVLRLDSDFSYHLYIQPVGETRLYEYQCELHSKYREVDCSSFKYYIHREGARSLHRTSAYNVLFRQDRTKGKDIVEISQGALDNLYTIIEYPQGSLSDQQLSFREFGGNSFLLVLKEDKKSIDIYEFSNTFVVDPTKYQNITHPSATVGAHDLDLTQIDELFLDTFIPNFPIIRSNNTFMVFNASDYYTRWESVGKFTPDTNHSKSSADTPFRVYVSFPRIVLISPISQQIFEYDMTNFTNITLRRQYLTYGCNFTNNTSQGILSEFSAGQNLLYVLCHLNHSVNDSYLFAYDVERTFRESALDYNYQMHPTNANIRKAIRFNVPFNHSFRFTVAPVDAVSDLIFSIKDGVISTYRLYRHYEVTGTISKDQYCASVSEYDCFYHTYIHMRSDLDKQVQTFVEDVYIDITFTQVPPKLSKALSHSTWNQHQTSLNTFELFDGSIFNFTIQKPEGLALDIKSPLNLQKESLFKLPTTGAVLDLNTNQLDTLYMVIGSNLFVFDLSLTSNFSKILRQHSVGPNCRHIFPVPNTQNFVLVCYGDDQIYNVSSYTFENSTLTLQWRKLVNSHSFKGKMTPDGKLFYVLYDLVDTNSYFVEQFSLEPNATVPVRHIGFPLKDFASQATHMPLSNNTFIQAFDIAINDFGDSYTMLAITNDLRVIYCKTSIANNNASSCRARMAYLFEPRPEQKPEAAIFNELKIINDKHFIVNTLNSFTYYFTTNGHDIDQTFTSADAEVGFAYFSDYPKYPHMAVDITKNIFVISSNGTSEDPLDCVVFMYADVSFWSVTDRGHIEPPLTVLSRPCPLPTYSPKILMFNDSLLMIDEQRISLYSSQPSYTLSLNHIDMFEPSIIELPIIAANDYKSVNVTWVIYGNLLYRPINYVVWITDAAVWFLIIMFFLIWRSRGVGRQLRASLSKYFKKTARKITDLLWEFSLPMMTTFLIYTFGKIDL